MGNFISWTSEDGLNNRDSTFMPEFGKDVSYSGPGGTSFDNNTAAFSNSIMSQALNQAQKVEAKKAEAARQATTEFDRISNPDTYDPTDAPESFHLGDIVGADDIDEKWDPEKWKDDEKWTQLRKEINTFEKEHDINNLSKEEAYELGKMYELAGINQGETKDNHLNKVNNAINKTLSAGKAQTYSDRAKKYLDQANAMDKADEEKAKETVGSSAPASSRFTADIDEKWDPEKWKDDEKWTQLRKELDTFEKEHGDFNTLSKEEAYELGKIYAAAASNLESKSKLSKVLNSLIGKATGIDPNSFADKFSILSNVLLDQANIMDKADEEKAKEKAKETVGSSAPASSRFTADMKGESKVDTTPSKTFEDVRNEFKEESKKETKPELNRDPLLNVDPRDYTDKPEFKNDTTPVNMADIKKAAKQTGVDPEKVKAIAGAPKFIQTIESKLGDFLLKMGRRVARYNPLTLAVALYESAKNGEGVQKSIDKAIDALGLERDSMTQDEYDALYKEIEDIRSSIDRGDFKISLTGRDNTAAATSDATPTDFFDGLLNTDKTDYSGYNAGLTASDKDTKEIIVRVYKKDPVLRLLKC